MASFSLSSQNAGIERGTRLGLTAWAAKQVEQSRRSGVTVVERRSGSPQLSAAPAPPESNADIEPTAAKASSQAFV